MGLRRRGEELLIAPFRPSGTLDNLLRERGYEVAAVNPNATEVEGDPCYPDLHSVPGGVEAVVIASNTETHVPFVLACIEAGKPVMTEKPLGITVPTWVCCSMISDTQTR